MPRPSRPLRRRRAILALLLLAAAALLPTRPAAASNPIYFTRFYPETGHNLILPFLAAWDEWGGLMVFGYPISESFMDFNPDLGQHFMTQYFERNRFEHHREQAWPYKVQLGRLGVEALQRQGRDWTTFPKADPAAPHYIRRDRPTPSLRSSGATGPAMGWSLATPASASARAWRCLATPISEPQLETNSSGDTVLTQWFERARFEYHPSNPDPYKVLLGLLGTERSAERRGEAPFQPAAELDLPHARRARAPPSRIWSRSVGR
ncbi:MAG: hypothetical protein KatS3mg057_1671 [Herpetosiphonaceae bacterium]|nr:MAG: hypothetical protein KatS3mg057_1671 [Herpetosiphonaceae bacterium]